VPVSHTRKIRLLIPGLLACLLPFCQARAASYEIRPGQPNLVRFESRSTLESFQGKTRQVTGHLEFDPANLSDSVQVYVEVDMATLDTGISLRNAHMRDDHLETDKYPKSFFRGGAVLQPSSRDLTSGKPVKFQIKGEFELHGMKREITVPVVAALVHESGGNALRMECRFPVNLSDFQISWPQFLALRVGDTQQVQIDLQATEKP
jgi:polyisoprenoid-binding protein YceI